jgi:rare lipoprotein A
MALGVVLAAFACAEKEMPAASYLPAASPMPQAAPEQPAPAGVPASDLKGSRRETGSASWYGKELHGRKTASGDIFDMFGLSAAHRTLPLGTEIVVTNLENFKTVKLRINDRGPFRGNTILELSYGAARELGFVAQGTTEVRIESPEQQDTAPYAVLAGVFAEEENAKLLKDRISRKFEIISIVPFESNLGKFYRVRVGSYGTEEKAEAIAGKLKLEGLEPFVTRKD